MSKNDTNGAVTAVPEQSNGDENTYRPRPPSVMTVHESVIDALIGVVNSATCEAERFVRQADTRFARYRKNAGDEVVDTATQLGLLVDATECLEIALTHMGQLRIAISHRLRVEDENNVGIGYQPI